MRGFCLLFLCVLSVVDSLTLQQTISQTGSFSFGYDLAASYNASTVVVSGTLIDSLCVVWVFTKSVGSYSLAQNITPTDSIGTPCGYGFTVALSDDASVLALGGNMDDNDVFTTPVGAVWIYRFNSTSGYYEEETKITAPDAIGNASQGQYVALSSNGTILVFTGPDDNSSVGATWIYSYLGGTWAKTTKLVGTGYTGTSKQGISLGVTPSADRIVVGGFEDNEGVGAVWVFALNGTEDWVQEAGPLVPSTWTGVGNKPYCGTSVSIAGDGDTIAAGSPGGSWTTLQGYVTLWSRNGTTWTELTALTIYDSLARSASQGFSVTLDSTGSTCFYGGIKRNRGDGAVWGWTQNDTSPSTWYNTVLLTPTTTREDGNMGNFVLLSRDNSTLFVSAYQNLWGGGTFGFYT